MIPNIFDDADKVGERASQLSATITWGNPRNFLTWVCFASHILSLPILVFVRTKIGCRTLNTQFFPMLSIGLFLVGIFSTALPGGKWLALFSLGVMAGAFVISWKRWIGFIRSTEVIHSYSRGHSRFGWLPLHPQLIQMVIDPLAVFLVAALFMKISPLLSAVLSGGAVALFIAEILVFGFRLERSLDRHDAIIDAKQQQDELSGQLVNLKSRELLEKCHGSPMALQTGMCQHLKKKSPAAEAQS
jgi:hypothetical protein